MTQETGACSREHTQSAPKQKRQRRPSPALERVLAEVPVTALAWAAAPRGANGKGGAGESHGSLLLAGEDADLCVYAVELSSDRPLRLVRRVSVFAEQPIHGICVQRHRDGEGYGGVRRALVWGASNVAVVPLDVDVDVDGDDEFGDCDSDVRRGREEPRARVHRAVAPDWIYDAAMSPFNGDDSNDTASPTVALVTAHNEFITASISRADGELTLGKAASPARPILFSAAVAWESPTGLLVAGGTSFGEILVWRARAASVPPPCEMLYVLTGHEGSIFGLAFSPLLAPQHGDPPTRLLVSCSDDRTVRVWDVTGRNRAVAPAHEHPHRARETGFGGVAGKDVEPVAVAMGHASRIWGVDFAQDRGGEHDAGMSVWSFGEDATAQKWRLCLQKCTPQDSAATTSSLLRGDLTHERTLSLHDGKHIWSRAVALRGPETLIATGGADGKISLIEHARSMGWHPADHGATQHLPDAHVVALDVRNLASPNSTLVDEIIKRYCYLSADRLLATTSLGRVLLCSFAAGTMRWEQVAVNEAFRDDLGTCYAMTRIGHGRALMGAPSGNVYCYRQGHGIYHVTRLPGNVFWLFHLEGRGEREGTPAQVLAFLHGSSTGHLLTLDTQDGDGDGALKDCELVEGLDNRFVPVCAAKLGDLLLVGSRHGWLSTLRRQSVGYRPLRRSARTSQDAITAIVPLPPPAEEQGAAVYVLTTGRDGQYRIYEIQATEETASLRLCHESSPPFGPWIEGAWFTGGAAPQLILYGFRSKDFIVWNESRREELASVPCGGAHRTFSLTTGGDAPERLRFAFTKASRLCVFSQEQVSHRCLKAGMHGREIRAISSSGQYIATGAEDTSIRIWRPSWADGGGAMRCVAYMKAHNAGIQGLRWLGEDYLFSSAGNEEFMVWRPRKIDSGYSVLGVVCESVFQDKSTDQDLRIMDFDVGRASLTGNEVIVTLALSSSTLKTYRYTARGGFELLASSSYTGACLTQARHLHLSERGIHLLTASTDGHLVLWSTAEGPGSLPQKFVLQQARAVHQSAIKSLDLRRHDGRISVMTGGDDNALGWVEIRATRGPEGSRRHEMDQWAVVRTAHAAAINGVVLMQHGNQLLGVSASNDQKVKLWRVRDRVSAGVELLQDVYSGVADAGDVSLVRTRGSWAVVVGGVGMETWGLNLDPA